MKSFTQACKDAKSLEDVLRIMTNPNYENEDFTDMPTFGGDAPSDTIGIWSLDKTRIIVGSSSDDFEIKDRDYLTR